MVIRLSEYSGEFKILVVAKEYSLTKQFLKEEKSVAFIDQNKFKIYPDNLVINIKENEVKRINKLNNFDIIEIRDNGIIYRWYNHEENEAGIAITSSCNSNCIMCPASERERKQNNDLSLKQYDTIIQYFPNNLEHFTVTGGEPTLIGEEGFIHIMNTIKSCMPNTTILILTNGRTFGSKTFFEKFLNVLPNHLRIAIPIHGSDAEKHDYIIQASGGFKQTMRGIKNVINANIELELRIVVSKLNSNDLENIVQLIIDYFPKVTIVNFIGLEMRGNCVLNHEKVVISYEEAFKKSKDAILKLVTHGIDVSLYNFPYCMIEKNYWPLAQKSIASYKSNFYKECEKCTLKEMCCGIFTTSMNFFKPVVKPIRRDDEFYDKLF